MDKIFKMLKSVISMVAPTLKKADSVHGTKETTEALIAVNELALFLITRLKDGVGFDDAAATWDKLRNDEEFKKIMSDGFDKIKLVPTEVKDTDIGEALELVNVELDFIPRFIASFKKEEVVVEAPVTEEVVAE